MTYDLSDEVCIAEKVEERVTEVMAGMSRRWKKTGGKRTGDRVRDGEQKEVKLRSQLRRRTKMATVSTVKCARASDI